MTRKNTTNRKYIESEKENLIKRMLPPENCSITVLSSQTGISKSTLSTWKKKAMSGEIKNKPGRPRSGMSSHEKFLIVMETYTLSEIELSRYCREHGCYVEDVKRWRSSCLNANEVTHQSTASIVEDLKEEKKKSKELSKEIRIKDKALAETTALLVMRKKLNAIFGEEEED